MKYHIYLVLLVVGILSLSLTSLSFAESDIANENKDFDQLHGKVIRLLNIDPKVRNRKSWEDLLSELKSYLNQNERGTYRALYDLAVVSKKMYEHYSDSEYSKDFRSSILKAKNTVVPRDLLDDFYYLEYEFEKTRDKKRAHEIRSKLFESFPDSDSSFKIRETRRRSAKRNKALTKPLATVVIDAGHGGEDFGAVSRNHVYEKDLALLYAKTLEEALRRRNIQAVFTRGGDSFLPLVERTAVANAAKAELFLSLHFNSSHIPSARGVELYFLGKVRSEDLGHLVNRENRILGLSKQQQDLTFILGDFFQAEKVEESKKLAENIYKAFSKAPELQDYSLTVKKPRSADFYVLIGSKIPALLLELPYLSNDKDLELVISDDFRKLAMELLSEALADYLKRHSRGRP